MDARLLGTELQGKTNRGHLQRFQVELYLGRGAFGQVYKTLYHSRVVALKITKRTFNDAEDLANMLCEALLLNELRARDPTAFNLIEIHGCGVLENYYNRGYIAMEYVPGGSLRDRLDSVGRGRSLPDDETVDILCQVCAALHVAHSQKPPILHRDIKPSNILSAPSGLVKLSDWGLAARSGAFSHTLPMAGDLRYEAPEALEENLELPCSDIYGLGLVAYEMVTGHYPFPLSGLRGLEGRAAVAAHAALRRGQFIPPSRIRASIPPPIEAIVLKMLAYDRCDRYQSVEELLADLEAVCRGKS
jgi:serine/threonine protein kinase